MFKWIVWKRCVVEYYLSVTNISEKGTENEEKIDKSVPRTT